MKIIGYHGEDHIVEDTENRFGGQHAMIGVRNYKQSDFKGLIVNIYGCEKTDIGIMMELFGKHKSINAAILPWKRKSQKKIDLADQILQDNVETIFNLLADKKENLVTTEDVHNAFQKIFEPVL